MITEASVHPDLLEAERKECDRTYFKSRFDFLTAHNGIRRGYLHGLIAPTSTGKSTLLKAIIDDTAQTGRVVVWLSEGKKEKIQLGMKYWDNIYWVEERKVKPKSIREALGKLIQAVDETGAKAVFIDNMTSSIFYGENTSNADKQWIAEELGGYSIDNKIPIFYLAHTIKGISKNHNKVLEPDDIRGNAQLAIRSEYMYSLNCFTYENKTVTFIKNLKYRDHDQAHGHFILGYDNGEYIGDQKVDFDVVQGVYQKRDRLTDRPKG